MKDLLTKYRVIIELLTRLYGDFYVIGLDTEWHEVDGRNIVLSYQLGVVSVDFADSMMTLAPEGQRKTLAELIESGIRLAHGGELPIFKVGKRVRVLLVAHYFVAEWSALADRAEAYITENLTCIRKTIVTGKKPIVRPLSDNSLVDIHIFDTKLLAPATHQSLERLSSLLGDEDEQKKEISQFYKQNMHLLLRDDPDRYERYAIRDAELCVELFFLLQQTLNQLAGGLK